MRDLGALHDRLRLSPGDKSEEAVDGGSLRFDIVVDDIGKPR